MTADPWEEDAPPPKWIGQRAGCVIGLAVGLVGVALLVGMFVLFWYLVHGS